MKNLLFGIIFGFTFVLLGCSPPIKNGEVVQTTFVPEHEEERDDPDITIGDITIPGGTYTVTIPDQWFVTIEKVDESGTKRQRTIQVTETEYNGLEEGDWYSIEK